VGLVRVAVQVGSEAFAALEGGSGRPVLFLHGFPDHPPTAEPFLDELIRRGHRVLAPWLRGYRPSPIEGPYDLDTPVADALALIDRWAPGQRVDVVGHDWGAAVTYALCQAAPARIARAVTMALPHPLTFLRQLRTGAQARRSWYIALFQLPGSGRVVAARDLALIDLLWRHWSPNYTLDAERRSGLHTCIADSLPAPLEYYRTLARPLSNLRSRMERYAKPITTPLLQLHGADDGCVLPPTLDDSRRFEGPRVLEIVPEAGHFLHVEKPTQVGRRVASWLATA
jgi:pimeloyl-ACP methyl ester carboxylesterase